MSPGGRAFGAAARQSLKDWRFLMASNRKLYVLPGDGIGPEVVSQVLRVVDWLGKKRSLSFDVEDGLCGGASYDAHGTPLTDETLADAMAADAVLFLAAQTRPLVTGQQIAVDGGRTAGEFRRVSAAPA